MEAGAEGGCGYGIVTARAGGTAGVSRHDHLSLVPERHAATKE